ncbi:MAG TPA: hypothetical protein VFU49_25380 [Ktedonobacteraceae bacterium]|nr:hypothetical protein [Ktedonobacteraceae bacterium]
MYCHSHLSNPYQGKHEALKRRTDPLQRVRFSACPAQQHCIPPQGKREAPSSTHAHPLAPTVHRCWKRCGDAIDRVRFSARTSFEPAQGQARGPSSTHAHPLAPTISPKCSPGRLVRPALFV